MLSDFTTVAKLTSSVQTFGSASALLPAFVFIGGDFDHREPVSLAQKRTMFHDLYNPNTPFMSDFVPLILRKFPIAHQWDDHDSGMNNLDKNYPLWDLNQQAYQENVPTYPLPSVSPGIWQKFSYAQADFFVLDCRSQRDRETDPDDANKSMLDGNALGATGQLQWLKDGLLASTAVWKVIFTSVVTNTSTKFPDAWGGYQTEWLSLKQFINSNNIHNVVFISGDLHQASIDNGTQAGFPEMCAPTANKVRSGGCATGSVGHWSEGYYDDDCAGFAFVSIAQNPDQLTLQTADEFGTVHLSYQITAVQPTPTPTPTATATPTPTPTPTPTDPVPVPVQPTLPHLPQLPPIRRHRALLLLLPQQQRLLQVRSRLPSLISQPTKRLILARSPDLTLVRPGALPCLTSGAKTAVILAERPKHPIRPLRRPPMTMVRSFRS